MEVFNIEKEGSHHENGFAHTIFCAHIRVCSSLVGVDGNLWCLRRERNVEMNPLEEKVWRCGLKLKIYSSNNKSWLWECKGHYPFVEGWNHRSHGKR